MEENENGNAQRFLELIRRSRRGKFKIYIGMIAGVGKTYRMLSEAHDLLKNGIDGDSRSSRNGGHARRFARDSPQESLL